MDLSGHRGITKAAVTEFLKEYRGGTLSRNQVYRKVPAGDGWSGATKDEGPEDAAVTRDLIDVVTLGHWSNFAQKHHFMRRQDGQSPKQAYNAGLGWVYGNALTFAKASAAGKGTDALQALGNACHAVEDSFADGHCQRDGKGPGKPGEIEYLKVYAGKDKEGHEEGDKEWKEQWAFDLPKNAVKALLGIIFDEVLDAGRAKRAVASLAGWSGFVQVWLKPSSKLRDSGAYDTDLIDVYTHGKSLDHKGLGQALFSDLGTHTNYVQDFISRLDLHDNSNADDVAEVYVNKLRDDPSGPVTRAVGRDKALKDLLIKVLDEGWTTANEKTCIDFLKKL